MESDGQIVFLGRKDVCTRQATALNSLFRKFLEGALVFCASVEWKRPRQQVEYQLFTQFSHVTVDTLS